MHNQCDLEKPIMLYHHVHLVSTYFKVERVLIPTLSQSAPYAWHTPRNPVTKDVTLNRPNFFDAKQGRWIRDWFG